ncbi:hypothetical protein RchiOBHm_Chr5g0030691 [Rosa chinensis]|uniref:Uncharacterized protein n=1 Tax=Rosa chinensis TaxID=74649 RepID=A0A2P6QA03_ROSCH|nr:hypothetical protein RchiOBHm_Chr5g0030691 [Rosa chinensis]
MGRRTSSTCYPPKWKTDSYICRNVGTRKTFGYVDSGWSMMVFPSCLSFRLRSIANKETNMSSFLQMTMMMMILTLMTIYGTVNCLLVPCSFKSFAGSTGLDYESSVIRNRGVNRLLT